MTHTTTTRARKKNLKGQSECGASLVEYGLLVSLIAAVSLVAITEIGQAIANNFCSNAGKIDGQASEVRYDPIDRCCKPGDGGSFGSASCP